MERVETFQQMTDRGYRRETIADVQSWPGHIEAVTASDLTSAAERYLVPHRSVTGYLRKA